MLMLYRKALLHIYKFLRVGVSLGNIGDFPMFLDFKTPGSSSLFVNRTNYERGFYSDVSREDEVELVCAITKCSRYIALSKV